MQEQFAADILHRMRGNRLLGLLIAAGAAFATARADEGMWTFDNFPTAAVAERYGVDIGAEWLERVRLATIRLAGCTASFVSADGLILTNNHCVQGCLAQHSSRDRSLIDAGFLAAERREELRCGTQIADVLVELEEITPRVTDATRGLDDQAAKERRRQTLTTLEQSCEDSSRRSRNPLKCEAVTLYGGGQYWLYKYRRYDDVRLVFTPEIAVAAFGGDPDNFQFPRWCLDMALLRAYVDGRPASTPNHLEIDFAGPEAGELVLVAGHPGSTDRQLTVAQLLAQRNRVLPPALLRGSELRGRYLQFAKTGEAAARIVSDSLNGLENGIKVQRKELDALHDEERLDAKRADEAALRARAARDGADPWARIEAALETEAALQLPYAYYEGARGFDSPLFRWARLLVRAAAERPKPNAERLREYRAAALPRLEQQISAPVPIYPELEQVSLSFSLERMREWLGPDHPLVRRLLATQTPDQVAAALIGGSSLADPAARLALWNGGQAAIDASTDTMIELARALDAQARALRKRQEDEVDAVIEVASEAIATARFAALGTSVYPDATFTLRLNFGTVQGWTENGQPVAPFTRLGRLFERTTGEPPFALPQRWLEARPTLDLDTAVNVATDNDIIGGNSGSPLLDADGKIVGLIFDGNIHSISGAYWFDPTKNRSVAVSTPYIREALTKVYRAQALVEELGITN
jgi:peptidase S46-like protein